MQLRMFTSLAIFSLALAGLVVVGARVVRQPCHPGMLEKPQPIVAARDFLVTRAGQNWSQAEASHWRTFLLRR